MFDAKLFSLFVPRKVQAKIQDGLEQLPRAWQQAVVFIVSIFSAAFAFSLLTDKFPVLGKPLIALLYGSVALFGALRFTHWLIGPVRELLRWAPDLFLHRDSLSDRTVEALLNSSRRLVVLTGDSGAGKSTLATSFLTPTLTKAGWLVHCVEISQNETTLKQTFKAALESLDVKVNADFYSGPRSSPAPDNPKRLLIVDQFEQLLNDSPLLSESTTLRLFDKFLADWLSTATHYCLLILRREFFLDLRFLDNPGTQLFSNTIEVRGVEFSAPANSETQEAVTQLKEAAGDDHTVDLITQELQDRPRVLALEVAMMVHVLNEARRQREGFITTRDYRALFGGHTGMLRRFFGRVIDASGDRRTVSAVLFALSCRRRTTSFSAADLQLATHSEPRSLGRALRFLTDAGIVRNRNGQYALKHDYLAESFDDVSAGFLDAEDRDTIQFFAEATPKMRQRLAEVSRVAYSNGNAWRHWLVDALFGAVALGIVLRLFGFWNGQAEQYYRLADYRYIPPGRIDWRYLPAFVGSAACTVYCWQLFRNLLFRMCDMWVLTAGALGVTILMIGAGTLLPHLWLLFACIAGIVIGLRLKAAYWGLMRRASLYRQSLLQFTTRRYFLYQTLLFLVSVLLAVVRYPVLVDHGRGSTLEKAIRILDQSAGFTLEGSVAFAMLVYMLVSLSRHATQAQSAVMLGFWDRMKTAEADGR